MSENNKQLLLIPITFTSPKHTISVLEDTIEFPLEKEKKKQYKKPRNYYLN